MYTAHYILYLYYMHLYDVVLYALICCHNYCKIICAIKQFNSIQFNIKISSSLRWGFPENPMKSAYLVVYVSIFIQCTLKIYILNHPCKN